MEFILLNIYPGLPLILYCHQLLFHLSQFPHGTVFICFSEKYCHYLWSLIVLEFYQHFWFIISFLWNILDILYLSYHFIGHFPLDYVSCKVFILPTQSCHCEYKSLQIYPTTTVKMIPGWRSLPFAALINYIHGRTKSLISGLDTYYPVAVRSCILVTSHHDIDYYFDQYILALYAFIKLSRHWFFSIHILRSWIPNISSWSYIYGCSILYGAGL